MSELRCSNSYVNLDDGQELFCENTTEDIAEQLSKNGKVILEVSNPAYQLQVSKEHIMGYYYTD